MIKGDKSSLFVDNFSDLVNQMVDWLINWWIDCVIDWVIEYLMEILTETDRWTDSLQEIVLKSESVLFKARLTRQEGKLKQHTHMFLP